MVALAAVAIGAALGALLRWQLGVRLNAAYPPLPPGTLVANLLGGGLVGIAMATFGAHPDLAIEWRLLSVTGFLGGLTTFSTFSAEVAGHVLRRQPARAIALAAVHVVGSVAMTFLGYATGSLTA